MVKTYAYGFPRIGKNREYKRVVEGFWNGKVDETTLVSELQNLEKDIKDTYSKNVDGYPSNEMTLYDRMLDTAIMLGVYNPKNTEEYYELCRGKNCLEMTKWFNTNYHYLVPDLTDWEVNTNIQSYRSLENNSSFIGPFTFLKLSKGVDDIRSYSRNIAMAYSSYINNYKNLNSIHIEEPAFVMDLTEEEISCIKEMYYTIRGNCPSIKINIFTYYEDVDWLDEFLQLPVDGFGLDFVNGKNNYNNLLEVKFPENKTLFAGLVSGLNVWRTTTQEDKVKKLSEMTEDLYITNAGPLYHLPVTLENEDSLDEIEESLSFTQNGKVYTTLKSHLSFATEKLKEIKDIAYDNNDNYPGYSGRKIRYIQGRMDKLSIDDFVKPLSVTDRRPLQDEILKLPNLPTTTIGSFPQTKEVRKNRIEYKQGKITEEEYNKNIEKFISDAIEKQHELDLDVLVHGESERSDMVEHFCQRLEGICTTDNGWIISYGTRVYRPAIIYGDINRPEPMTVKEISYAQSLTDKPVKGILTGPTTIMAWVYVREDIPEKDVAYQLALALQDEIRDYEDAGIKIVQVDEPAFRELVPIKKRHHDNYFNWSILAYNLATNTKPTTQIHCHMCYSEFNEIVHKINQLDFDVLAIEATRSKGEVIECFEDIDFKRQIGIGVWDIHSPSIPSVEDMNQIIERALEVIPIQNFWVNPDCGLKTRTWEETLDSLENMVQSRNIMNRAELHATK